MASTHVTRYILRLISRLSNALAEEPGPIQQRELHRVAEDVEEILGGSLGARGTQRDWLQAAVKHLRSSRIDDQYFLALQALTSACTAEGATHDNVPRIARVPVELIAHIIEFAQSPDDFHAQQCNNMSFTLVSRDWHRVVAPRLRSEIHLTRAYMAKNLDHLRRNEPERKDHVKLFSADIQLADYIRLSDSRWYGCFLPHVLTWLASTTETAHFRIRPPADIDLELMRRAGLDTTGALIESENLAGILGQRMDFLGFFEQRPGVVELHLDYALSEAWPRNADDKDSDIALNLAMILPGPDLRRLYIIEGEAGAVMESMRELQFLCGDTNEVQAHPWEVMAAPILMVDPRDAVKIFSPGVPSTLTHLELSIDLRYLPLDQKSEHLQKLIDAITPSIKILHLRIVDSHTRWVVGSRVNPKLPRTSWKTRERDDIYRKFMDSLCAMGRLQHLTLGGLNVSNAMGPRPLRRAPALRSLTLLPTSYDTVGYDDEQDSEWRQSEWSNWRAQHEMGELIARHYCRHLRALTIYRPDLCPPNAKLIALCRRRGISVSLPPAPDTFRMRESDYVPE